MKKLQMKADSILNPKFGERNRMIMVAIIPVFIILLNNCAKIGSPTGGPRDTAAPVLVTSEPENRTTNFTDPEIEIEFDEYVQLNNLNDELLVSPPLEERPVVSARNKSVLIDLNNDLLPNTTYTLNFGNSILDNNEGNVLTGFEFVFSTGGYIDSLAVTGEATAAFDLSPPADDEHVYIMLFENLADSAPMLELPRYIGKVGLTGLLSIHNIQADTFRAIVLNDFNGNMRYDPVTDGIGFTDSLVIVSPATVEEVHFITDTIISADSTFADGILLQAVNLNLNYFHEENDKVFLNNQMRESSEKIFLTFTRPAYEPVGITLLNHTAEGNWYIPEYSERMDTLTYWITDTTVSGMESISLLVSFTTTDLSGRYITQKDTVQLLYRRPETAASGNRRSETNLTMERTVNLVLTANVSNTVNLNPNGIITLTANRPLADIDTSLIDVIRTRDTLSWSQDISIIRDSTNIRRFMIPTSWEGESSYQLILLPGAVSDIYGLKNDSLNLRFKTLAEDYYGNVRVIVQGNHFPVIVQVLNEKKQIIREGYLQQSGFIDFSYLMPGNYSLKAIHDRNGNGGWDTGNYLRHIQPESVFFFNMPDEIRSSWDYEYTWQIAE